MNAKYFKYIFMATIVILIIAGVYIIYIKDIGKTKESREEEKEIKILKEITIGITEFDTINPIVTKNLEIQHITKLVYEPLIDITEDFKTKPSIAEEWSKINELTYIIKLNEEKKFADGKNVNVEDIEYTINFINETDSIYKENIKEIEAIEKVNNNTFKIHLKEPVTFFEYLLCFPIIEHGTKDNEIPSGVGKYKITQIDKDKIIIENNDIQLIIKNCKNTTDLYNQFARGEVDLIVTRNTDYENYIGNIGFEENIITGRNFYYISCENIKETDVRKALEVYINRENLIYDLYNNRYIAADFPLAYGSYLNKEKKLMKENAPIIKDKITISTSNENRKIAEKIKENLEENNVKVTLLNYQTTKADLILKSITIPIIPRISQYFEDEQKKEEIETIMKIENKEILKEKYNEIIEEYYNEVPFISLYFDSYIVLHTNKLKGDFSGNWYNMFYNIDTWYKIVNFTT